MLRKIRIVVISLVFVLIASPAQTTVDAETPEQVLDVLRLLLLESEVHTALAEMRENGCVWRSEAIWFGASEMVSEGTYRWGGNFSIWLTQEYNPHKTVSFVFSGLHNKTGKTIDTVTPTYSEISAELCS